MIPSHLYMLTEETHTSGQAVRMGDTFVSNYTFGKIT